jgi:hypothetical protein
VTLTAEQHSQIATAYEKAAADRMVPPPQREAFAKKAVAVSKKKTAPGGTPEAAEVASTRLVIETVHEGYPPTLAAQLKLDY